MEITYTRTGHIVTASELAVKGCRCAAVTTFPRPRFSRHLPAARHFKSGFHILLDRD